MGDMKKQRCLFFAVMSLLLLVLLISCTTSKQEKAVTLAKLKKESTSIPFFNTTNAENTAGNATNASLINEEGIRVRRLSDNEVAYLKRNTKEYETLREQKYGTRIDLTQVNAYNCRFIADDLKKQLAVLVSEVKQIDDELQEKEQDVEQTREAYDKALASDDTFEVKTARFEYNDAQNEYDEVRKESKQAHQDYDETERTKRVVELKCTQMRKEAGLKG